MKFHHNRRGIGLREVIIVGGLIGLVFLMLAPLILRSRENARRNACLYHQKLLSEALIVFEEDRRELPGYANLQDGEGTATTGWLFPILPYLQSQLYPESLEPPVPPYLEEFQAYSAQGELAGKRPDFTIYEAICPDDAPEDPEQWGGFNSYVVNGGMPDVEPSDAIPADWAANGIFQNRLNQTKKVAFEQFTLLQVSEMDGLETSLLLGENVDAGAWTSPKEAEIAFVWSNRPDEIVGINQQIGKGDGTARFARLSSYHPGGVNLMFASGAGKFVSQQIDAILFAQMQATNDAQAKVAGTEELVWPEPDQRK
ncbi:DUF1559 domain-containing protein [Blastopirellula sp. JC732]|uniref:DUF1559 domain-containing protein n=1 Tax=Blastopirellula sediminis TaxID=2894196 RepID=A0A9X1MSG7_9BACT|nr:DUF1559 domain-containing protein [Blastopirellula sediminis]MCC9605035.1 DUF1559 domain-containing protein [Blastopirellula sediminis]MCC9631665.1 DUF1559 domain-containing protein [Blastopirellula sediminis]